MIPVIVQRSFEVRDRWRRGRLPERGTCQRHIAVGQEDAGQSCNYPVFGVRVGRVPMDRHAEARCDDAQVQASRQDGVRGANQIDNGERVRPRLGGNGVHAELEGFALVSQSR